MGAPEERAASILLGTAGSTRAFRVARLVLLEYLGGKGARGPVSAMTLPRPKAHPCDPWTVRLVD